VPVQTGRVTAAGGGSGGTASGGEGGRERLAGALIARVRAAGWSVEDLAYATDHAPDGTAHWHTTPVHSPAEWLAARLAWWVDGQGTVRPARSAQLAAAAAEHRRRSAEWRAEAVAAAAAVVTPERRREHLAAIRAALERRRA
jgi:hypothetical protein